MKKTKKTENKKKLEFSKKLIDDIRILLWIVTIGGLVLAAICICRGYLGSLPWLSAMVGLPWTAHGAVCSFYLNMAKSDHKQGGITYETARAKGFYTGQPIQTTPYIDQYMITVNDIRSPMI